MIQRPPSSCLNPKPGRRSCGILGQANSPGSIRSTSTLHPKPKPSTPQAVTPPAATTRLGLLLAARLPLASPGLSAGEFELALEILGVLEFRIEGLQYLRT